MANGKVMDVDRLTAVDVHTHVEHEGESTQTDEATRKYFGAGVTPGRQAMADYYRSRNMACVIFTVDERLSGRPQVSNDSVLAFAAENSDIMLPFISVDPTRGPQGISEAKRLLATGQVRGFKLHPPTQQFFPNDRAIYPFYRTIEEAGLPVIFHTGHSGIGTGMPGGGGVRLKYGNPMYIDDVAVDFPDLKIIMAHPSFPWQDEAISICLHKRNVYIDLSGWSPKYFAPNLIQYGNSLLRNKLLFGSDYPLITPDRWLADFEQAPFKDEVRPLILKQNAAKLLGLQSKAASG